MKKFNEKLIECKPYLKLNDIFKKILIKNIFHLIKERYYLKNENDNELNGLVDISYIRNRLHISIIKRIPINGDEINKYQIGLKIIPYIIKRHIYRYFIILSK